ncbi:MAG: o-succinylbenzoate synthase [Synechococcaceae bacterium WB8_1B_136]|nr:o-succinylbenzoate synthase [Synechococcaceae bacterium WB8_1B_136]
MAGRALRLQWRPFAFALPRALVTAHGAVQERRGWLLRLEDGDGRVGWGEAAPLDQQPEALGPRDDHDALATVICQLGAHQEWQTLDEALPQLPGPLAFAIGAALAELDGLVGGPAGWLAAPRSALLLPAGRAALPALERALHHDMLQSVSNYPAANLVGNHVSKAEPPLPSPPFTVKWKVATGDDREERDLLETLLKRLPAGSRLRLDANCGWRRPEAIAWAERLAAEPALEWLEQPLPTDDLEGLEHLARLLPVALDESLAQQPVLRQRWKGWQVRRPALEGDPRPLLADLQRGSPHLMVSTAFETGIGRRWLEHLAALQLRGPTPTAPGLAQGWCPPGELFVADPQRVWQGARCSR